MNEVIRLVHFLFGQFQSNMVNGCDVYSFWISCAEYHLNVSTKANYNKKSFPFLKFTHRTHTVCVNAIKNSLQSTCLLLWSVKAIKDLIKIDEIKKTTHSFRAIFHVKKIWFRNLTLVDLCVPFNNRIVSYFVYHLA